MTLAFQRVRTPPPLCLDLSAMSHSGAVRASNQDAWLIDPEMGLLLIADGVGGQGNGAWASRRAVWLVARYLRRAARYTLPRSAQSHEELVRAALHFCERQMRRHAMLVGGRPSGTTLVGLWISPRQSAGAVAFNIGDSSLFRIAGTAATKISHDHSLHQLWVNGGQIGTEPSKRVITQALGISANIHPHIHSFTVEPGDVFVACTDGLTGALSQAQIAATVSSHAQASEGTRALLCAALEHLARDNVTAAVCKVAST